MHDIVNKSIGNKK